MPKCLFISILALLVGLVMAACGSGEVVVVEPAAVEATEPPEPTATQTPYPATPTATSPPSVERRSSDQPSAQLTDIFSRPGAPTLPAPSVPNPWLVFTTTGNDIDANGVWALSADGEELIKLVEWNDRFIVAPYETQFSPAPSGSRIAFITVADPDWHQPILTIIDVPSGDVTDIPLTSPDTEPDEDIFDDWERFEPVRTLIEVPSFAWSPDGTKLAFMGVMDGPSTDLYVFDLETEEITRLTSGTGQGINPSWSPDGKYIVHAAVGTLGTGAGWTMLGVWAAAADGSEVLTLYNPDDVTAPFSNAQESFVGWLDDETFIAHSADINCGSRSLRTYNLQTGEEQMLWPGYFAEVVFDPSTDVLLLTVDRTIEDFCDGQDPAGVYQLGVDFTDQILFGSPGYPVFREDDAFYVGVDGRGMMRITTAGQVDEIPAPVNLHPFPAPDKEFWAWGSTDGLWIGLYDEPPVQVGGIESVAYLRWSPDGSTLFFTDFSAIYRADKPGFTPQVIADDLELTQFEPVWVFE